MPPYIGGDRKRCKPDRSQAEPFGLDPKSRESDITCDARVYSFRDEGEHKLLGGSQAIDEISLRRTAEGVRQNSTHRQGVGTLLESHVCTMTMHVEVMPAASTARTGVPRKNSSAFIAWRPARCNSSRRTAPSRHAMVSRSSSTVPGAPAPSPLVVRSTLTRAARRPRQARTRRLETAISRACDCAPLPRRRPIDAGFLLLDLIGIGYPGRRLRRERERAALERAEARTIRSAPTGASRSCRSPAVASGPIGTRSAMAIGPVSSPASIFITITPVSVSPAITARLIGAAPRQRGKIEA